MSVSEGREMFREDLTGHLAEIIGPQVHVTWLVPDVKAGCVRFGLSDGRVGDVRPGDVGGWSNAKISVSGS